MYTRTHRLHLDFYTYVTESNHVVPKTECATLYSCFRLVTIISRIYNVHSAYMAPLGPDALEQLYIVSEHVHVHVH